VSAWLPPRVIRRAVIDPLWLPVAVVLAAVFVVGALLGLLFAPFTRRRRLLRFAVLGLAYVWMDVGLVLGCFWFWLRQPGARRDAQLWRDRHAALLGRLLSQLMQVAGRVLGYRVELVGRPIELDPSRPLIMLARHGGPGDSFTLVHLLVTTYHRRPKVVLKQALQWDPGLDLLLSRLESYFLPSGSGAGEDRAQAVARMTAGLRSDEALLLFPEGANWTLRRHRRAVVRLLRAGSARRAARVRNQRHVLPPRPGGTLASLNARNDTDVMIVAHTGLDTLVNPAQMWAAIPLQDRPMRIRPWLYSADSIPRDEESAHVWLEARWAEIDQWIDSQR
jgi:1-acyl-sn-glycerol-3-phosphate acyltransferase